MRLNLNFKDATITQTIQSEYRIVFDLSNMIRPRLSQDARMYIEHLNFPEFLDEAFGDKGQLRGYFELICENIQNDDYDSEYGNGGSCVLYTSPLVNFKTFTNNDPMYISNFKINSSFLKDKLVFILKIYDQNGYPYDTAETIINEVNINSPQYSTFNTAVKELDGLNTELEGLKLKYKKIEAEIDDAEGDFAVSQHELQKAYDDVKAQMEATIKFGNTVTRTKLKIELFKVLFQKFTKENISYLFEVYINSKSTNSPFTPVSNLGKELRKYYNVYLVYVETEMKLNRLKYLRDALQSSNNTIWHEVEPAFTTITTIKPELLNVDYSVPQVGGTKKTGKITLDCFTSVSKSQQFITIYNIIPDSGDTNKLVSNDILEIESSKFHSIIPETYTYTFVKSDVGDDDGVSLTTTKPKRDVKYIIDIKRETTYSAPSTPPSAVPTSTTAYSFSLLESKDKYTIVSEGFSVGDEILFKGDYLGGESGTNDYTLEVETIEVPVASEVIKFTNILDIKYPSNGTFSLGIKRTNIAGTDYILDSEDYTKTKEFNVGNTLNFQGTDLNGDDGVNDLELVVDDVIVDEKSYTIDSTKTIYSKIHPEINSTNTTIVDIAGAEITGRTPADFIINVKSVEDDYFITWDSATDTSSGFEDGDEIKINGAVLSGITGTNDLNIIVTADATANGKLLSLTPNISSKSRLPKDYEIKIKVKANTPNYIVEVINAGTDFKTGDVLTIEGNELGGKASSGATLNNQLKLVANVVNVTTAEGGFTTLTFTATGTPNSDTGNIGQIKSVVVKGQGKFYPTLGKILKLKEKAGASKTPVTVSAITKSKMTIKLPSVLPKNYPRGIDIVNGLITTKYNDISTAKTALVTTSTKYITSLSSYQKNKLKCMNMRLILYDEIPEYTQSSQHAITGNTYGRIQSCCQVRRIG